MLTTIKLYGHLAKRFGKVFEFDIDTAAESIRALSANLPGFKAHLLDHSEPGYRVYIDKTVIMDEAELGLAMTRPSVIKIVPVVQGAGDGKAIGKIILGVVLVIVAAVLYVFQLYPLAYAVGMSGITMLAGGISELVSSIPKTDDRAKQAKNYGFANSVDTIEQGLRVPIIYGQILADGLPVSVRLDIVE